jgi:hypothetical protein
MIVGKTDVNKFKNVFFFGGGGGGGSGYIEVQLYTMESNH